ncbi:MAG TPA: hypothetical protein VF802_03895 [Candidatus Limnocylindrales bacterium]
MAFGRRLRSEDVLAVVLVIAFVVSVTLSGGAVLFSKWFEPKGGLLGEPTRITTCGFRSYRAAEPPQIWTLSKIRSSIIRGYQPVIFEPVLGQLPVLALFAGATGPMGACDTLVFLRTGSDAYGVFALEGGP